MDVFGRSAGPELLQLLNQGSSGITALTTEAQRMGAVISTETAAQAGEFNDAIDRAKIAANGLYLGIAKEVLPVLNNFSGQAQNAATSSGVLEKSATALGVAFKTIYTGGAVLGNVLGVIGDQLGRLAPWLQPWLVVISMSWKRSGKDRTAVEQYKASILELGNIWNDVGQNAAVAAQAQRAATGGSGGNAAAGLLGAAKGGKARGAAGATAARPVKKGSRLDELLADEGIARDVTDIAYDAQQRNRDFEETEARRVQAANESAAQLEYLKEKQLADEKALQEAKRQEIGLTRDFFLSGLDQMAQRSRQGREGGAGRAEGANALSDRGQHLLSRYGCV